MSELLRFASPALESANESNTSPIRSSRENTESSLAASAAILARRSGVYSTRSVKAQATKISMETGRNHIQTPTVFALSLKDLLVSRGKNFSRSSKIAVLSMEYLPSFQERIDRGTFLQRHELHSKSTKIQTRQIVSLSLGSAKPVSRNLS